MWLLMLVDRVVRYTLVAVEVGEQDPFEAFDFEDSRSAEFGTRDERERHIEFHKGPYNRRSRTCDPCDHAWLPARSPLCGAGETAWRCCAEFMRVAIDNPLDQALVQSPTGGGESASKSVEVNCAP